MWSDPLLKSDINISASGDNTVIAAPGVGLKICIDHINFVNSAATDVQLKDGATAYGGAYPLSDKGGIALDNAIKNVWGVITLTANTAFVINSTVATQISGFVRYRIIQSN